MLKDVKEKYIATPAAAKAVVWFTACNFLVKGISFVAIPVFAYLMSPDEYGLSALYLSYQEIILICATWEMYLGGYQRGLYRFDANAKQFTVSTIVLINILTISCFLVFIVFQQPLTGLTRMPFEVWGSLFIYYLFFPAYNCWMMRKRKSYQYRPVVLATICYALIVAIVPMVCLIFIQATATVKMMATYLPAAAFCAFFYFKSFSFQALKAFFKEYKEQWKYLVDYQAPLILHSLAYYVLNQSDIVMISALIGDAQAAYYSVAYGLAMTISIVQTSINQSLVPWRYEMMEKGNYDAIARASSSYLFAIGSIIVLFVLVAPEVILLLFKPEYHEAIWCIPPISLSAFFIFLYSMFVNIETYFEETKYVMYVSIVCALLNIVLNFIGIMLIGYAGCAYATFISYVAFACGHFIFMKKIIKKHGLSRSPFNTRSLFSICVLVATLAAIAELAYLNTAVRIAYICLILVLLVVKRKRVMALLRGVRDLD